MSPQNAQLAYLSACSTADNSAEQLVDEIIRSASGFQLIGIYRRHWDFMGNWQQRCSRGGREFLQGDLHDAIAYSLHEAVHLLKDHGSKGSRRKLNPNGQISWWWVGWLPVERLVCPLLEESLHDLVVAS